MGILWDLYKGEYKMDKIYGRERVTWKVRNVLKGFITQAIDNKENMSDAERREIMNTVDDLMKVVNMYDGNIKIITVDEYNKLKALEKEYNKHIDDGR